MLNVFFTWHTIKQDLLWFEFDDQIRIDISVKQKLEKKNSQTIPTLLLVLDCLENNVWLYSISKKKIIIFWTA